MLQAATGLAQCIDSAAMILYLSYIYPTATCTVISPLRELNGPNARGAIANAPIDDLDLLLSRAVIRF